MNKETAKVGNKVKIIPTGENGTIKTIFENGAMVERDTNEERRFITVGFDNLEPLTQTNYNQEIDMVESIKKVVGI